MKEKSSLSVADLWSFADKNALKIGLFGLVCIILSYGVARIGTEFIGTKEGANWLFRMFAIGFLCIGFWIRKIHWFAELFFYLTIYNMVDELMGKGSVNDWFEYLSAFILIGFYYGKYVIKNHGSNN